MKITLVYAIWCPSCIIMKQRYNKIIKEYNIEAKILDFDDDEEEVDSLNVGSVLPVCIIEKTNERIIGEKSEQELTKIFERLK